MRRLVFGIAVAITGTSLFVKMLFGVALHLFTVFIAYNASGILAAVLTLLFPVMAQIYWLIAIWADSGIFMNLFTIACLLYVALWLVIIFAGSVAAAAQPAD